MIRRKPSGFPAMLLAAALFVATIPAAGPVLAIGAHEALADPANEARARALFKKLRCLVCQNQSIDDSDADLARDLRILVRQRIEAGDSDKQVIAFLTGRYGDFVLLKPPFKPTTWLLWGAPFGLLLLGGAGIYAATRRRRAAGSPAGSPPLDIALDDEERRRLDRLLGRPADTATDAPADQRESPTS